MLSELKCSTWCSTRYLVLTLDVLLQCAGRILFRTQVFERPCATRQIILFQTKRRSPVLIFLPAVFPVHVHTCFRVPDSRFTQADDDLSLNVMQNGGKLQDAFSGSISAAFNRNPSINELSEANLPGQA